MKIESVRTNAYGWEGALKRHNIDRNNYDLPRDVRNAADKAHKKIVARLEDKALMSLRECLLKAAEAGDEKWIDRYSKQIRDYLKEDLETGL